MPLNCASLELPYNLFVVAIGRGKKTVKLVFETACSTHTIGNKILMGKLQGISFPLWTQRKTYKKKDNHYRQTRIEDFYFSKNKGNEEYETDTGENDKTKCN